MIRYILPSIVVFALAAQIRAAVITDPALATGAGAIAPGGSGYRSLNTNEIPANATPTATLEALAGFGVIQNFSGVAEGENIFRFTDPARADVKISFSGSAGVDYATAGGELTTLGYLTSPGAGIRIAARGLTSQFTMSIDFGSWNGAVFDSESGSTGAAGFTLSGADKSLSMVTSITASFVGTDGNILDTQVWSGPKAGARGLWFGYQATGAEQIGRIDVTFIITQVEGGSQMILGFDDLGFAATSQIPEPSHLAMIAAAGALAFGIWFRRRR
ncbi:PEP-CTERM putative exosortase interaction domain-containing protein [Opitutaceae bacterium TAV1]|nr:PEP-CTERM putative exosortase interaction domain-containing protein [Opitutaceae bacterium TAV1]